jgi:hypothetical protein
MLPYFQTLLVMPQAIYTQRLLTVAQVILILTGDSGWVVMLK